MITVSIFIFVMIKKTSIESNLTSLQALREEECLEELVYYASLLPHDMQVTLLSEVLCDVEEVLRGQCAQYAADNNVPVSNCMKIQLCFGSVFFVGCWFGEVSFYEAQEILADVDVHN